MDELLDGEIFYSLREAEILIESWRRHLYEIGPVKAASRAIGMSSDPG